MKHWDVFSTFFTKAALDLWGGQPASQLISSVRGVDYIKLRFCKWESLCFPWEHLCFSCSHSIHHATGANQYQDAAEKVRSKDVKSLKLNPTYFMQHKENPVLQTAPLFQVICYTKLNQVQSNLTALKYILLFTRLSFCWNCFREVMIQLYGHFEGWCLWCCWII